MNNSVGRVWLEMQRTTPGRMFTFDDEMLDELERRLGECSRRAFFLDSEQNDQLP